MAAAPARTTTTGFRRFQGWLGTIADRRQDSVLERDGFDRAESMLLRVRAPYVGLLRAASVSYLLTYGRRGRTTKRAIVTATAFASAAASVSEVLALRRSERRHALPRMVRDVAETSATAFATEGYSSASVSGAPLMTELAFRVGPVAALGMLPHAVGALTARRAARRSPDLDHLYYLIVGYIGGIGVRRVEGQRARDHHVARQVASMAARADGRAAGRRSVAFHPLVHAHGATLPGPTAHECIGNCRAAFSEPAPDSELHQILSNRRAELWGEDAPLSLGLTLARWMLATNSRRGIGLSSWVSIMTDDDLGSTVIEPMQQRQLEQQLDAADLVGEHRLELVARSLAGTMRMRLVGPGRARSIIVSASRRHAIRRLADPIPAACAVGVLWAVAQATKAADALPRRAASPGIAGWTMVTGVATLVSNPNDPRSTGPINWLGLAAATLEAMGAQREARVRPLRPDGSPRLPVQNALIAPALLQGYTWPDLSMRDRLVVAIATAGLFTTAVGMMSRPRPLRALTMNMCSATAPGWIGGTLYRRQVERDRQRELMELQTAVELATAEGWREGAREEWELVREAAHQALRRLNLELAQDELDRYRDALRLVRRVAREQLAGLEGTGDAAAPPVHPPADHIAQAHPR